MRDKFGYILLVLLFSCMAAAGEGANVASSLYFGASDVTITAAEHKGKMLTIIFEGPWKRAPFPEMKTYQKNAFVLIAQSDEEDAELEKLEKEFRAYLQKKASISIEANGCATFGGNSFFTLHQNPRVKISF